MTVGEQLDQALTRITNTVPLRTILLYIVVPHILWTAYRKFLHVPRNERAVRFAWQVPAAAQPGWRGKVIASPSLTSHLAAPSLLPATAATDPTRKWITAYAPASAQHLATLPATTALEISDKIARAERAQADWKTSGWGRRRKVMRSLLRWLVEDMEPLARVASRDTGKTLVDAAFGEILTMCEKLRWICANGEQILSPEARSTNWILAHKTASVHYDPLGVVCAITSWNYPLGNALAPIIAALFSGNAIVLKASENVAWSSHIYVDAIRACLRACGENEELVQIVTCWPDVVESLTGDPRIKHITFIGSEMVGQKVALKAAEDGTPVVLELGGKDPCIILPSADTKYFSPTWLRATFQASGNNCIGVERFIVHSSLYPSFIASMEKAINALQLGDVLAHEDSGVRNGARERVDVGSMVTDRGFDELERLIKDAVKKGAKCLVGGKRWINPEWKDGHYFSPTLLIDVTPDMEIAQQEVFAPVMCVLRYEATEEAIALANGTRYGLGASVFGKDKKECGKVVKGLECGMVSVNDFGVFYLNQALPFGGVKASGYGRFAGPEGLRGLCNLKSVIYDRFHGVVQTGIPPLLQYPIASGQGAWSFVHGLVRTMFGEGVGDRVKGVLGLLGAK